MRASRAAAVLAVLLVAASSASCAEPPPPRPVKKDIVPVWADVFDGVPDIYAVLRPRSFKHDGLYGSFWTALVRAAEARGFARGATMVEAVEGAEEIIVGIDKGVDAALVLRGVPASLDPQRIADSNGDPLFRPVDDRAKVLEYQLVDRTSEGAGALFILPDRTWVGTLGDARARAKSTFASPLNRAAPRADPDALASVRFGGRIAHALDAHPRWGPLGRNLSDVTFALMPGKGGLVVTLVYADAASVAWGAMQAKRILGELAKDEKAFGWLKDASTRSDGNAVFVRVAIPPRLLEELPRASGADLGL